MLAHLITHDETLRMTPADRPALAEATATLHAELLALPPGKELTRTRTLSRWTGVGLIALGQPEEALGLLHRAFGLAVREGAIRAVVATEINLADAYRYAGMTVTADAHYRTALHRARTQCPELLDYALHHLGKHLTETGHGAEARACLLEALRLREAKDNEALISSTQDALERLNALTGSRT